MALAQLLFYTAISKLELATVATLGQTGPIFIVILAIVLYKEYVGVWRWAAIFIGFLGAVLVIRPGSDIFTLELNTANRRIILLCSINSHSSQF